jgi:hypothetical protein
MSFLLCYEVLCTSQLIIIVVFIQLFACVCMPLMAKDRLL